MKQLNWATLGCGVIANELAQALSKEGRTLYSVANRLMKRLKLLHKNMAFQRYMTTLMTSFMILMWISFTSPLHTILTLII